MCSAVVLRLVHRVRGVRETSKLKQLQPGLPDHSSQPFLPAWELGEGPCSAPRWSPSSHGSEIRVTVSAPLQPVGLQDPFADPSTLPSPLHHKERDSFHHLSKKSSNSTRPPTTHSQSCYCLPKEMWAPPWSFAPCLLLDSLPQGRATGFFLIQVPLYMTRCTVLVFKNSKQHKTNPCPWRAYSPGKTLVNLQTTPELLYLINHISAHSGMP